MCIKRNEHKYVCTFCHDKGIVLTPLASPEKDSSTIRSGTVRFGEYTYCLGLNISYCWFLSRHETFNKISGWNQFLSHFLMQIDGAMQQ